ncbi:hypothetical protein JMJ56_28905 [Belnapia sp. T18]|uniref:N-acetyltransferase domain-containing protein n=1 Tax=Belnapia arida TaxID=2804533 RepID=A0ABS1UBH1_9PROT|nr:hypothetical protein [Belnapia arida]MBL6082004.1 hypothetical protein [Belnapia arida]
MVGLRATTPPLSLLCSKGELLCIASPRHAAAESASAEIDTLRDYADRLGVQLRVQDGLNGIELEWLCRRPCALPGTGSEVLSALCSYADRAGRPVRLIVLAGRERLLTFYNRFGFDVVRSAENDCDSTELARLPAGRGPSHGTPINYGGVILSE